MSKKWYHLIFVGIVVAVVLVLYLAPEETTPKVPWNADHADLKNYARCAECHLQDVERPLPRQGDKIHVLPDGTLRGEFQKCYMCHKRAKGSPG